MHRFAALAVVAVTLGASQVARAQQFADQGVISISVDRAFGFTHTSYSVDPEGPIGDSTQTTNNFGFLGQGNVPSPFAAPRASFDYFVIDGLNIGGSLAYWSLTGEFETPGGVQTDLADQSAVLFAPRVGYAIMFSDVVGFWPRGGFSFYSLSTEQGFFVGGVSGERSESGFAFNADLPFVFVPVDHAAILVGPAFDVTLGAGGEVDPGNADYDAQWFDFGIYAGLGFWF